MKKINFGGIESRILDIIGQPKTVNIYAYNSIYQRVKFQVYKKCNPDRLSNIVRPHIEDKLYAL